jgi:hypothetical protein
MQGKKDYVDLVVRYRDVLVLREVDRGGKETVDDEEMKTKYDFMISLVFVKDT